MSIAVCDMIRRKTLYPWSSPTNFMTTVLALAPAEAVDPKPIYLWMISGKNNANAKFTSKLTPAEGSNPNISTQWDFMFKLPAALDFWFIIGNQPTTQFSSASLRGYGVKIDSTNSKISLFRLTGGGGSVLVNEVAWTTDTNLHWVRVSREISGANRFWRLYVDTPAASVAGPTNDTTYTDFQWWGFDHLTNARIVCGQESCRS